MRAPKEVQNTGIRLTGLYLVVFVFVKLCRGCLFNYGHGQHSNIMNGTRCHNANYTELKRTKSIVRNTTSSIVQYGLV